MIALRLFTLLEVEQRLWRLKCKKVREHETAAIWKTPTGFHFSVPQFGPEKRCDELTFNTIIDEITPYLGDDRT